MVIAQYRVLREPHAAKRARAQGVQQLVFVVNQLGGVKLHGFLQALSLQRLIQDVTELLLLCRRGLPH